MNSVNEIIKQIIEKFGKASGARINIENHAS